MKKRRFASTGKEVPVIGLGTWALEHRDRDEATRAVHAAIDAGMTHIDTAEMYGGGAVETLLGEILGERRDEVFLVSKILPSNATREGTAAACEATLRRLKTEVLDCYLLHWVGPHPMEETFAAFEDLVRAGKIRSWGVSNFDEVKLKQAIEVAGLGRIACNQVLYHLKERSIEHAVIPFCEENAIPVVAYSPLGSGDFPDAGSDGFDVLEQIGTHHDATPRQVALAFLLRYPEMFAIPMSGDPDHVRQNAAAAEIELSSKEIERIDHAFPRGPRRPGVPTLRDERREARR